MSCWSFLLLILCGSFTFSMTTGQKSSSSRNHQTHCPFGWFFAGKEFGCILLETIEFPGGTNWYKAQDFCEARKGHLVESEDPILKAIIMSEASRLGPTLNWWIGAIYDEKKRAGRWFTSSDNIKNPEFVVNNAKSKVGNEELIMNHRCILISAEDDFKWKKSSCTLTNAMPICQIN